jgi:protocatechuate 3,4-dioxygenase beta subunit
MAATARPQQRAAAPQTAATTVSVQGTVVKASSGQAMRGARVTLTAANSGANSPLRPSVDPFRSALAMGPARNAEGALAASTDESGRFIVTDVAPGAYFIWAEADGYLRQAYGQRSLTGRGIAITIEPGRPQTFDFQLTAASVISGRVFDADGEPLRRSMAQAYAYQYADGKRTLAPVGARQQTNDLGEYRLFWLEPGDYFVGVTPRVELPAGRPTRSAAPEGPGGVVAFQFFGASGDFAGPVARVIGGAAGSAPVIYHPGVADPAEAVPVTLAAAAETRGVDVRVRPLRTVTVSGRVTLPFASESTAEPQRAGATHGPAREGSEGSASEESGEVVFSFAPVDGFAVRAEKSPITGIVADVIAIEEFMIVPAIQLTFSRAGESADPLGPFGAAAPAVRDNGDFEIHNVIPGSYDLTAIARSPDGKQYSARVRIDVGDADVTNVSISPQPNRDISGRIHLAPPAPENFDMTALKVTLVPEGMPAAFSAGGDFVMAAPSPLGIMAGGKTVTAEVREDGSFVLAGVAANPYRVRVTGLPSGAFLQAGRSGATDPLGSPFVANDNEALQLQLGFAGGEVTGAALNADGTPYVNAFVALVPDTSRRGRTDLYFSASSGTDGAFRFSNVPPGKYTVLAWEEIPTGAHLYPDFVKGFEDRGQAVTVEQRGATTSSATVIPAAGR